MCLAVPGRIIDIEPGALPYANVKFGGITRRVCLAYVPDAVVGDHVIVHVGFAISKLDEAEAQKVFSLLEELGNQEASA